MLRSRWALWAGILVFPPLGLVLWWMRRGVRPVARIAGTLAICVVAIVELFAVYGMRLEWNGALKVNGISFETRAQTRRKIGGQRAPGSVPSPRRRRSNGGLKSAPRPLKRAPRDLPAAYWTDFRGPNRARRVR